MQRPLREKGLSETKEVVPGGDLRVNGLVLI